MMNNGARLQPWISKSNFHERFEHNEHNERNERFEHNERNERFEHYHT